VHHLVYAPLGTILYPTAIGALGRNRAGERAWTLRVGGDFATLEFPNPDRKAFAFTLHDVSGRIAFRRDGVTENNLRIDKGALKSGVYFFRLASGGRTAAAGKLILK
jgi:hypothetical protein